MLSCRHIILVIQTPFWIKVRKMYYLLLHGKMVTFMSKKRKWTAEEINQWYKETGALTYANAGDANIIVKKPKSLGLTVNWANPFSYVLIGLILAVVFGIAYMV